VTVLLPTGCALRVPAEGDAAAVALLVGACEFAAGNEPSLTDADLLATWRDLAAGDAGGAWLIEAEVGVVGYAQVVGRDGEGYVNPCYRGRGMGPALLRLVEARAAAGLAPGEVARLRQWVPSGNVMARTLMEAHGYARVLTDVQLRLGLSVPPPAPVWPAGVAVRPLAVGREEDAVYRLAARAFGTNGAREAWFDRFVRRPAFDPRLWTVAWAGAEPEPEPVGAAVGEVAGELGWVRLLCVDPRWRRRGLGLALLRRSFGVFHRRGLRGARLGVEAGNRSGAHELYAQEGMRVVSRHDRYEKDLHPGERLGPRLRG
jgi:mycothiol synthase